MTDTINPPERRNGSPTVDLLGLWLRQSWSLGAIAAIAGAAVVLCTIVALPVGLSRPKVYGAQAELVFDPGLDTSDAAADRALVTQQVVIKSRAVLEPVAKTVGIPVMRLEEAVSVDVVNQSNVVRITAADRDPDTARRLAQLVVDQYQKQASLAADAEDQRSVSYLEDRVKQLADSLAAIQGEMDGLARQRAPGQPPSIKERELQVAADATKQRLQSFQGQLTNTQLTRLSGPHSRMLTSAHVLEEPLRPRPFQAIAAGVLVGLLVATVIVLVLLRPRFAADRDLWG